MDGSGANLVGYMDHNAASPLRPEVHALMARVALMTAGNPSSLHLHGVEARLVLERSRRRVARLLGAAHAQDVRFTSGGTESLALAVIGGALAAREATGRTRLIIGAVEHVAVIEAARYLEKWHGFVVDRLPVDRQGRYDPAELDGLMGEGARVALVAVMLANNETGVLQPATQLARIARNVGAVVVCDAAQAPGRVPCLVEEIGAHLTCFSAHKFGGPRGIGCLVVEQGVEIVPLAAGGGQEGGVRGGTEDVAAAAAMAEGLEMVISELPTEAPRLHDLRETLWRGIHALMPEAVRHTPAGWSLPNTLNVSFPGWYGRDLVRALDEKGFSVSSGSACHSTGGRPSHVLLAMGLDAGLAGGAVRFSLGRSNEAEEVQHLIEALTIILPAGTPAP